MSINNEDENNPPMASRTRFLLLVLVVLCLMINWANILTFNFTVVNFYFLVNKIRKNIRNSDLIKP